MGQVGGGCGQGLTDSWDCVFWVCIKNLPMIEPKQYVRLEHPSEVGSRIRSRSRISSVDNQPLYMWHLPGT